MKNEAKSITEPIGGLPATPQLACSGKRVPAPDRDRDRKSHTVRVGDVEGQHRDVPIERVVGHGPVGRELALGVRAGVVLLDRDRRARAEVVRTMSRPNAPSGPASAPLWVTAEISTESVSVMVSR